MIVVVDSTAEYRCIGGYCGCEFGSEGVNLGLVSRFSLAVVVVCYWYATELVPVPVLYDALVSYITFTHHPTLHLLR